jgi:alkylhydroperoxidase family enzyme
MTRHSFKPCVPPVAEEKVRDLVALRRSQLNGCAFCLNAFCVRNTSALLPDRFHVKSFQTLSKSEDSAN